MSWIPEQCHSMKHQILAETNRGIPPNLRIACKTQELRRQGWPDNIGCQEMQEDGEPILDTGSHILAIINLIFNTS